jgi:hypothetical protein
MDDIAIVSCGWCSGQLVITRAQWENDTHAACPNCPEGGADLIHARRHADGF